MFKRVAGKVWAFDAEWVPDPEAGRRLYGLADELPDRQVLEHMWQAGGASEDDPTPFLKTVLCRVVSISAVTRHRRSDGQVSLALATLPRAADDPAQCAEAAIIGGFLGAVGEHAPQLVGFNSGASDLKILMQRGVVNGIQASAFCARPDKPWEGVDYFARGGEFHVDLRDILGGFGRVTPSLHELATLSGIPGKLDVDGDQVAELWLQGRTAEIAAYNECDALTTYLVWLRLAHFGGHFDARGYAAEQERVEALIDERIAAGDAPHLERFRSAWETLRKR